MVLLHYGENQIKLVDFREQKKKYFVLKKTLTIMDIV